MTANDTQDAEDAEDAQDTRDTPDAPDTIPNYIADGLTKQDNDTLADIISYAEDLMAHNDRPIEDEIPDDADVIEESEQRGTIFIRKNTCGDENCHCLNGGEKHGPYRYLAYRDGKGNVVTEYQGKANES